MAKYINPFTDFGFKCIFGREESKPFLMDFLNELLKDEPGFETITDIRYLDKEKTSDSQGERTVIYDILCQTADESKKFIVEMQNSSQAYFTDRSLYYISRAFTEQGKKGKWDYRLMPVYFVAFMNFTLPQLGRNIRTDAAICDLDTKEPVTDRLRLIYIQLPYFRKPKEECTTVFDQWIYILKNMETMESMPFVHEKRLFDRLAKVTSYASLSEVERRAYDADLQAYRDIVNQIDFARQEGMEKGMRQGREEGMRQGMEKGMEKGMKKGMEKGLQQGMQQGMEKGMEVEKENTVKALGRINMAFDQIAEVTGLTIDKIKSILSR